MVRGKKPARKAHSRMDIRLLHSHRCYSLLRPRVGEQLCNGRFAPLLAVSHAAEEVLEARRMLGHGLVDEVS